MNFSTDCTCNLTAVEKGKLREWISNAGLDTQVWYPIFFKAEVLSMTKLMDLCDRTAKGIRAKVRNKREEQALDRLLRLDLSGDGEKEMECLRGCGVKVKTSQMGEHECLLTLRKELEIISQRLENLKGVN